ncbi:tRNA 2-thiouridine(34) synthase MnmA [bacterium]|nr:tRNA 2-thiouridine(34) synthase MnmA [bacterium]
MTPTIQSNPRVLVAMSGGVDSSLAAVLLRRDGYDIVGVNMRTHRLTPEEIARGPQIKTCCSPTDAKDARACADRGDFPFYVLDVEPAFERDVIDPFVRAYMGGRTPNPCVLCNNLVKLGLLLEKARMYGCEQVATGHYARKERHPETGRWVLRRAADRAKDQCYYLYGLTQKQLAAIVFPLGELTKAEVRALAATEGLPTAEKPESQEICFIPDNDYRRFLRQRFARDGVEMPRGRFLHVDGRDLGEHEGIPFYTVGQRRGLGIADREPLYVVAIDTSENNIIVGPKGSVLFDSLTASGLNWMGLAGLEGPRRVRVQIRHRHEPAPATLSPTDDRDCVRVNFATPQRAVSPGQAVVFYDDEDRVLGGGWIDQGFSAGEN